MASRFDAVVVGAGAAGLYCAGIAGQRGLRVLVVDHAERVAEKIRISGGGRCNFTNVDVAPAHFLSANPHFCRSALARCTPRDFIALIERHGVAWHEKHKGQLFCDDSSERIVQLLLAECGRGGVERWQPCSVGAVEKTGAGFALATSRGAVEAPRLVVATGGLSIPKIGASDFGYALARRFEHAVVETKPGLVPFVCTDPAWAPFAELAGLAVPVRIGTAPDSAVAFDEDLLFTHRGLSGPAALQISSYWSPGRPLAVDLAPGSDVHGALLAAKRAGRRDGAAVLAEILPRRLAQAWAATRAGFDRPLADWRDRDIAALADGLHAWPALPAGTEGYRKAEVTAGGVDTCELDSRTMESRRVAGLYFVGEVVDVTGWLGGYNFQWAWASGAACANALTPG